ncbi:MAG: hypothetical protein E6K94_10775 [Thaumarchaeota archaeon]|jgi:hypothetical protein|nr:MAG: hypothetical protein E6K94_10775 [Nitrososphaerota archaeon]
MHKFFYGNNPRSNKHRPTPTLRPVNISKELLKDFRDLVLNPRTSRNIKKRFMVEKAGGYCSVCGDIATQIASYNMVDATLVEKYCDTCLARGIN